MNSRATSVTSLRLYQSAITACLVFWRKNCHPAIWDFYNKIGTKRTIQLRPCLSAIGLTTDKRRPGGRTAWQRLTHIDSGVCVAAVEVRGEILVYRGHRSRMRPAVRVITQPRGDYRRPSRFADVRRYFRTMLGGAVWLLMLPSM